jgi:hypothetical protein
MFSRMAQAPRKFVASSRFVLCLTLRVRFREADKLLTPGSQGFDGFKPSKSPSRGIPDQEGA